MGYEHMNLTHDKRSTLIGMMAGNLRTREYSSLHDADGLKLRALNESHTMTQILRILVGPSVTNELWAQAREAVESIKQMDDIQTKVADGRMSINQAREELGLGGVKGGDFPYVMTPTGAVPVDEMDRFYSLVS